MEYKLQYSKSISIPKIHERKNYEKRRNFSKGAVGKKDETETFIKDKSMRWTYAAMVLTAGIFAVVRGFREQPIMDLAATVCISVCAGQLYRFFKTKDRFCFIMGIITSVVAAVSAVGFFMGH